MPRPASSHSLLAALALATLVVVLPPAQTSTQTGPPTPQSVIGFHPCSDYQLATSEQIAEYFRELDAATPRLKLVEIGQTTEGRPQLLAVISSEDNLAALGKYQAIARRLALAREDARLLTDDEARALARDGKAVVWIDFGLHSTEVAAAQTAPLLAYRTVTDDSDDMRAIRHNVIFLLNPDMNPDGTTYVADWYMHNVGKPWEGRPPELWHKYVGHDTNRDWFMMTQRETRNSARQLYAEWFPQIVDDHHQSAPYPARIFVPPFDNPTNPSIPPLVRHGVDLVGTAMTRRLAEEGKGGAISRAGFDMWWNGGMRTAPYFHNMVGILTETAHPSATPAADWRLATSCDYMLASSLAVLDIGARRRQQWLYDIYRMGREAITGNEHETFLVPTRQWDMPTAAKLINVLRLGGVEVERALTRFEVGRTAYDAGTYLIRGAQPFAPYVRDLLTPQRYPDRRPFPGAPPERPYDIAGWTLSYQMGVHVDRVNEAVDVETEKIDVAPVPLVTMARPLNHTAAAFAIDPRQNDAFIVVNRLLKAGDAVFRSTAAVSVGDDLWPTGTFIVTPAAGTGERLVRAATMVGVSVAALDRAAGPLTRVTAPRIGVYHAWGGNVDEGWTRWLLEQFEFPYARLHDRDVRAGSLRARFDVIVLPDATYDQMINGLPPGSMPAQYTGGMGRAGVANLSRFTAAGGTLIAMDRAVALPLVAFKLPIRDATAGLHEFNFHVPGSVLKIRVDNAHPVGYGMPSESAAFSLHSPGLVVERAADARIVAHYPAREVLMSGWLIGERSLAGTAAVVEAQVGRGRAVLLGFRTQNRGQSHATFKLLFNSLILGGLSRSGEGAPTKYN